MKSNKKITFYRNSILVYGKSYVTIQILPISANIPFLLQLPTKAKTGNYPNKALIAHHDKTGTKNTLLPFYLNNL